LPTLLASTYHNNPFYLSLPKPILIIIDIDRLIEFGRLIVADHPHQIVELNIYPAFTRPWDALPELR
jgi:hypothetical protein